MPMPRTAREMSQKVQSGENTGAMAPMARIRA
jgi:hypothetical protein